MAHLRMITRRARCIAWIFFAVIVTGVVTYVAAEQHATNQAQTNYENSLGACLRGNPKNEAYTMAVRAAAEHAVNPTAHEQFLRALRKIDQAPYTRANGTTECRRAVRAP